MLLTEGIEEGTYKRSQSKKTSIGKAILEKQHTHFQLYIQSPRMVPDGKKREEREEREDNEEEEGGEKIQNSSLMDVFYVLQIFTLK